MLTQNGEYSRNGYSKLEVANNFRANIGLPKFHFMRNLGQDFGNSHPGTMKIGLWMGVGVGKLGKASNRILRETVSVVLLSYCCDKTPSLRQLTEERA